MKSPLENLKDIYNQRVEIMEKIHRSQLEELLGIANRGRIVLGAVSLLAIIAWLLCFTFIGQLRASEHQVEQLRWLNDHADYTMTQAQVDALHTCKQTQP